MTDFIDDRPPLMAQETPLQALWVSYKKEVLPPSAPEVQVNECKQAFFAGIKGLWDFIGTNISRNPGGPTDDDCRKVEIINNELEDYITIFQLTGKVPPDEQPVSARN
jgi:hypothetical protein